MLLVHRRRSFRIAVLVGHRRLLLFRLSIYQTSAAELLQPPGNIRQICIDKLILRKLDAESELLAQATG
jgi:hypothetical protein